jgi:hypothetical protein
MITSVSKLQIHDPWLKRFQLGQEKQLGLRIDNITIANPQVKSVKT